MVALGLRSAFVGRCHHVKSEVAHPRWRCVEKFRASPLSFRMAGRLRREDNRGHTANVGRGPLGQPCSVLFPPASSAPRRQVAHRADVSSAPACFVERCHGDSARASTPLRWFANAAFCLPARESPRGETQLRTCQSAPTRAIAAPMYVFPTRWSRLQRS